MRGEETSTGNISFQREIGFEHCGCSSVRHSKYLYKQYEKVINFILGDNIYVHSCLLMIKVYH